MSDGNWGIVLGIIGMFLFPYLGIASAGVGYAVGSTIGSLIDLRGSGSTTYVEGIKQTDFKGFSSKYGIPIARGYGTVRLGGNVIWAGDIDEIEHVEYSCIATPVLFIFNITSCTAIQSFKYYQSAAVAYAEGPACEILRIWADGKLVHDIRPVVPDIDISTTTRISSIPAFRTEVARCHPENGTPFRIYLGTPTQKIDRAIANQLGPDNTESGLDEAYAFRNLVYVMVDGLELEPFGFRMPNLTAEVAFEDCGSPYGTRLPESPVQVCDQFLNSVGYNAFGKVVGRPELLVGVQDLSNKARVLYNIRTHQVLFEATNLDVIGHGLFKDFNTDKFELSPDFNCIAGALVSPGFRCIVADFFSGQVKNMLHIRGVGPTIATGGIDVHRFDSGRNVWWVGFSQGPTGARMYNGAPGQAKNADNTGDNEEPTQSEQAQQATGTAWTPSSYGIDDDNEFSSFFSWETVIGTGAPSPLSIEIDTDCNVYYFLNSADGFHSYCFRYNALTKSFPILPTQLKYSDGEVPVLDSVGYDQVSDSFLIATKNGTLNTPPRSTNDSLWNVPRKDLEAAISAQIDPTFGEYFLPAEGTIGRHIPNVQIGPEAMHHNIHNGAIWFADPLRVQWLDIGSMTPGPEEFLQYNNMTLGEIDVTNVGALGFSGIYYPHLRASVINSTGIIWWRSPAPFVLLSDIVSDLLLRDMGDTHRLLSAADIDVTELTDEVKGFSVYQQSTIRGSIEVLQQAYFFDIVETDGKIVCRKRGRPNTFALVEDELAAHNFDSQKDARQLPVTYERQTQVALPRELTVSFTSYGLDYLQGSQRARRNEGQQENNTTISLAVVLSDDEAAKIADSLLGEAHVTRLGEYEFLCGPARLPLNPTDVGTITMRDGVVHKMRLTRTVIGANGIIQCQAVREVTEVYTSTAKGIVTLNPPETIPNQQLEALIFDVTTRPLYTNAGNNQAGLVAGVGALGACEGGGCLYLSAEEGPTTLAGCTGLQGCTTWGISYGLIGHSDPLPPSNVIDSETTITLAVLGGLVPDSVTVAEALDGRSLMVINDEIIAYTDIEKGFSITGTDISAGTPANTLNSTLTDFVVAGFAAGDCLTLQREDSYPPYRLKAYRILSVTANQIVLDPNNQVGPTFAAGIGVVLNQGPANLITLTNCLRGLFGTEQNCHHEAGARFMFLDNTTFFAPVTVPVVPQNGSLTIDNVIASPSHFVSAYAQGSEPLSRQKDFTSVNYTGNNLKPWAPGNILNTGEDFTWQRRDKWYTDGIVPSPPPLNSEFPSSEEQEVYQIRIIDGETPYGHEGDVLYSAISYSPSATIPITSVQGATNLTPLDPTKPKLVTIHQLSDVVGRGHTKYDVYSSNDTYSGSTAPPNPDGSRIFGTGVPTGYTVVPIATGAYTGVNALFMRTFNNQDPITGYEMHDGSPGVDIETLSILVPRGGGFEIFQMAVWVRGNSKPYVSGEPLDSNVSGIFAALVHPGNRIQIQQWINGSYVVLHESTVAWNGPGAYNTAVAIRLRAYKNKISYKAWIVTDPYDPTTGVEPANWAGEAFDQRVGPYYGSCGFATLETSTTYATYFSWAHRGGTAP